MKLLFLFVLFSTRFMFAVPAMVGSPVSASNCDGGTAASIPATITSVAAHNALVVFVREGNSNAGTTVADNNGDTFTRVVNNGNHPTAGGLSIFVDSDANVGASVIVTASFTTNQSYRSIWVVQVSGLDTRYAYDTSAFGGTLTGTTLTTGQFTTSGANEIIFGFGSAGAIGVTYTAGAGYTLAQDACGQSAIQSKVVSSLQTNVTTSMTINASHPWTIEAVTFAGAGELQFDTYGGLTAAACNGGVTGYFYTEKASNNHWFFCTPQGNYMWLHSMYVFSGSVPAAYGTANDAKYGGHNLEWSQPNIPRLKSLRFNALADDTSIYATDVFSSIKIPWIRANQASDYAMRPSGSGGGDIKNLFNTSVVSPIYVSGGGYTGSKFPDIYDPAYVTFYADASNPIYGYSVSLATDPWVLGVSTDDADNLYGFKDSTTCNGGGHPNLGWIFATMRFSVGGFADTEVHSKTAWINFLKTRYSNSISALNTAWSTSSFYTSFDDAGGYATGTGVIDEDGSHSWIGSDFNQMSTANATARTDMNDFLYLLSVQYFSQAKTALDTYFPNQLKFSPASLGACTRSQILQAAGEYMDVVEIGTVWFSQPELIAPAYNSTGKPFVMWTTYQSQLSSPYSATPGWGLPINQTTQPLRGAAYAAGIAELQGVQGADNSYPVMGIKYWQWADNTSEQLNFGIVTVKDNAYDGVENVTGTPMCVSPIQTYTCGGETSNWGNYLGGVVPANALWWNLAPGTPAGGGTVSGSVKISGAVVLR